MMRTIIPADIDFDYDECRRLYEQNQDLLRDNSSFDEVLKNTLFYSFYDDDVLCLCVYFFKIYDRLYVNGFGIRKHHLFNKSCFELALSWFNRDIWAECPHKPAVYGLLCCGFKKYKGNTYVFYR